MRFDAENLEVLVERIFQAIGCNKIEVYTITKHLVTANLMGHDSHGVGMVPIYVKNFLDGILFPNVVPELTVNEASIMVFNGKRGFGQTVAKEAMNQAIERCKKTGLVLLGINNSGHMGRIGSYGEQSTRAGFISIHFVNVTDRSPSVAPFGGASARFGTNPICLAIPRNNFLDPLILDFATSKVAVGKIRVAINKNQKLPDGWVIDHSGQPSNDPKVLEQHIYPSEKSSIKEGAILPMGDYKGYGLSLFCEIIGGILSGGNSIQPGNERLGGVMNNMTSIIIDPEKLIGSVSFQNELNNLINYVTSSPRANPDQPILMPGEIERDRIKTRRKNGIEIDQETFSQIVKAAKTLGISKSELVKNST